MKEIIYVPDGLEKWLDNPQKAWETATLEQLLWILGRREVDMEWIVEVLDRKIRVHFGIERWEGHTAPIAATLAARNPKAASPDWYPWLRDTARVTIETAKSHPEDVFSLAFVMDKLGLETDGLRINILQRHPKERFTS